MHVVGCLRKTRSPLLYELKRYRTACFGRRVSTRICVRSVRLIVDTANHESLVWLMNQGRRFTNECLTIISATSLLPLTPDESEADHRDT